MPPLSGPIQCIEPSPFCNSKKVFGHQFFHPSGIQNKNPWRAGGSRTPVRMAQPTFQALLLPHPMERVVSFRCRIIVFGPCSRPAPFFVQMVAPSAPFIFSHFCAIPRPSFNNLPCIRRFVSGRGALARLTCLSARCLSSYLFFPPVSGISQPWALRLGRSPAPAPDGLVRRPILSTVSGRR